MTCEVKRFNYLFSNAGSAILKRMKWTSKARETMTDVSDASKEVAEGARRVVATSELAAIALIGVCAVSVLALVVGLTALSGVRRVS